MSLALVALTLGGLPSFAYFVTDNIYSMLAVMTLNIGYFLSVLGGTFLGSLAVGRYAVLSEH